MTSTVGGGGVEILLLVSPYFLVKNWRGGELKPPQPSPPAPPSL